MWNKNNINISLILLLLFMASFLFGCCTKTSSQLVSAYNQNPYNHTAFSFINIVLQNPDIPEAEIIMGSGSGTVIGIDTVENTSNVLTAAHVCLSGESIPQVLKHHRPEFFKTPHKVIVRSISWYGTPAQATIIKIDLVKDLCLLSVPGIWATPISLAASPPDIGTKVYSAAAPLGLFWVGGAPLFEGYYSGMDDSSNYIISLPVRPGSSGSGVVDADGKLIAVITYGINGFENLGLGTGLTDLKKFLN